MTACFRVLVVATCLGGLLAAADEPKLVKLPDKLGTNVTESSPLWYRGRLLMFHSHRVHGPQPDLSRMYLFLADPESGKELVRFGERHSLGSALVEGDTVHAFAAWHSDNDWFHDIYHFWSDDLKTWHRELAIAREGGEHLLNSSVCRDEQGYLMAYESDKPVAFCFKFARSKDLRRWEKIPGLVFTGEKREYSACPVIRYFKPYYYVIYLHAAIPGHNGWVSFLARSKDLVTWQLSPKNPILEAGEGEGSNNSDVDLIEIGGKTYVYYFTGDQRTWGDLKRAVYPGPMAQFFASYFPEDAKLVQVSAEENDGGHIFEHNERKPEEMAAARARIPPVRVTLPANRLERLPATMKRLCEGPSLRIVMLGDSIINDTARSGWHELVASHYPKCRVTRVVSVRGSTGCWYYKQPGKLRKYVLDQRPDLVVIGGISQRHDVASIRECLEQIRAAIPCEFLLMTGPFGTANPNEGEDWRKRLDGGKDEKYAAELKSLADAFGAEFFDMQLAWGEYVRQSGKPVEFFKRDAVHANAEGEAVLARILEAYFLPPR
jgi:hypothetical protein